jgi:DNA invertase Pin-like site-specific DNA recombinase
MMKTRLQNIAQREHDRLLEKLFAERAKLEASGRWDGGNTVSIRWDRLVRRLQEKVSLIDWLRTNEKS